MKDAKFRVRADLALFQAMQRDGRLSESSIALATNTSSTTIHYAMQRLRQRDFFHIKAVPKLEEFREIPMAIIGFANVNPARLMTLKQRSDDSAEILQFFHDERSLILFIMESSSDILSKRLFGIMEHLGEKPCLYIISPVIVKSDIAIPDRILDAVYANLPDRRIKI